MNKLLQSHLFPELLYKCMVLLNTIRSYFIIKTGTAELLNIQLNLVQTQLYLIFISNINFHYHNTNELTNIIKYPVCYTAELGDILL